MAHVVGRHRRGRRGWNGEHFAAGPKRRSRRERPTGTPPMVGGRRTRFILPWTKMVINSSRRRLFPAFSAALSFRLGFPISDRSFSCSNVGTETWYPVVFRDWFGGF